MYTKYYTMFSIKYIGYRQSARRKEAAESTRDDNSFIVFIKKCKRCYSLLYNMDIPLCICVDPTHTSYKIYIYIYI